ncbi:MAG: histidine--tRNA ligase [Phycisphaerales bacterium]
MASSDSKAAKVDPRSIGSPKGTRDFYPEDLLRRRYITEVWRAVSIRHGFEEIDGPTFEHSELYAVKSGEGILGELFQAFSGKAEDEREQVRETGNAPFALRPEFTPTLARMYAARAKQLPKPVRWFCVPNFFRAEKPQRGRLREFMQWNVDVIGGDVHGDADVISCLVGAMRDFGLLPRHARVHVSDRRFLDAWAQESGIPQEHFISLLSLLDESKKLTEEEVQQRLLLKGVAHADYERMVEYAAGLQEQARAGKVAQERLMGLVRESANILQLLDSRRVHDWWQIDTSIVRGLAYYTGTVFELIAEGERAVAGGGRYDNLIELFGGPPTPACGFGMGDVVLGNLLDDHGLMPADGAQMMDAIQRTVSGVSLRPEVFVVSGGEEHDHLVQPLLANLRAGIEAAGFDGKPWDAARFDADNGGVRPMHARTTAKATRNLKKLLADAERQHARFAVVIHGDEKVQLKDLDAREDVGDFAIDPSAREDADLPQRRPYVGRAIRDRLGN